MTQSLRKMFDLGVAAAVAFIIMNFAISSLGFGTADAQQDEVAGSVTFAQSIKFETAALNN